MGGGVNPEFTEGLFLPPTPTGNLGKFWVSFSSAQLAKQLVKPGLLGTDCPPEGSGHWLLGI